MRRNLVIMVVLQRLLVLILLRTSYVPDEYYQVIEPGYLPSSTSSLFEATKSTWEWEDSYRIRSYFLAFLNRLLYFGALKLGIQHPYLLLLLGRVPFAAASMIADILLLEWASISCPSISVEMIWLVQAFSWYWNFTSCRALTNSLEACGLVVIQYLLSVRSKSGRGVGYLTLTMLTATTSSLVFIRPTSVLFLIPMFVHSLIHDRWSLDALRWGFKVAWIATQSIILLDSAIYGTLTITPWNFLAINVFQSRAAAFGIQPWYWNISQGLPIVLGVYFPLVLLGLWQWKRWPTGLGLPVTISIGYMIALSLATKHQEHRFLLPCLPGLHLLIAWVLQQIIASNNTVLQSWSKALIWTIFITQAAMSVYLLVFHQAGTEAAFSAVAMNLYSSPGSTCNNITIQVIVAGPCYSFPGLAMISTPYRPVKLIKLPCKAPWDMTNMTKFDDDPIVAVTLLLLDQSTNAALKDSTPLYFVTFDSYEPMIKDALQQQQFLLWRNISHAHFRYDYDDSYPKYRVLIYRQQIEEKENI